jgi:transcriptional regulator with GAF, ATPase, and Fis domain
MFRRSLMVVMLPGIRPKRLIPSRRIILAVAGACACLYSLATLLYVHSVPDLGIRSAFNPTVRRFDGICLDASGNTSLDPDEGDLIVGIGNRKVNTWPQLLQATRSLRDKSFPEVSNLTDAMAQRLETMSWDGKDYVRLAFQRGPGHADEGAVREGWCEVGSMPFEDVAPSILWFLLKIGLFVVGALVFWKRPGDRSATQFYILCICTLMAYMGGYHWSRIVTRPELILGFMFSAVLLPAVLLHFYCVFPRPKQFVANSSKRAFFVLYGLPVVFLLGMIYFYLQTRWLDRGGYPDDEISASLNQLLLLIDIYLGVAGLYYVASVVAQVHSYRVVQDQMEKNQVKWLLFGSLAALFPIGSALYLAAMNRNAFGAGAATWPMFAASVCFTLAFIISITRYRLMHLEQILSSGMVYFLISCLAGLIYYVVVFLATLLTGKRAESSFSQAVLLSTTALVVLCLLDLARSRLKRTLDRSLSRQKHQLDRTIRRMGQAIEQLIDPPTLARKLLHSSAEVLSVVRGAVYLREGEPPIYRLVDSIGAPPSLVELSAGCPLIEDIIARSATVAEFRTGLLNPAQRQLRFLGGEVAHALIHEGELLGFLVLGARVPHEPFGAEDLTLLEAFTQLTAVALKSAARHRIIEGLNHDLQDKVAKISEQQRRINALQTQLMRQRAPEPVEAATVPTQSTPTSEPALKPPYIIGSGETIRQLMHLAKKASAAQAVVLIRGESGTGKELVARALHESSSRASKAFVKVHCAALSPGLLESELFGHVKGGFTGALRDKTGRFELADGGTLFLDEIGDISLDIQTKLLRVLQEMSFEKVGSSETIKVDVRLITATHQNLEKLIEEGRFRQDLYYRLNVISLTVPPLRDRGEDIPELAAHFLQSFATRTGRPLVQLEDDVLSALKEYPWPGNIRQMENVLERAMVVAEGQFITLADLPAEIADAVGDEGPDQFVDVEDDEDLVPVGIHGERALRHRKERERLIRALSSARGNKAEAARALGLARSTLVSRLKKHGLS